MMLIPYLKIVFSQAKRRDMSFQKMQARGRQNAKDTSAWMEEGCWIKVLNPRNAETE